MDQVAVEVVVLARLLVNGRLKVIREQVSEVPVEYGEHAHEEGDCCNYDLPWLAGAELSVRLEQFSQRCQHHFLVLSHNLK